MALGSEVVIDGVAYVRKDNAAESPIKIVILQRGHVMVGRFSQEGDMCMLTGASVIRRWGTTKGLGQLAAEGPQAATALDSVPYAVRFHILTVVAMLDCEASKWAG